jgi:hypothetical protein
MEARRQVAASINPADLSVNRQRAQFLHIQSAEKFFHK